MTSYSFVIRGLLLSFLLTGSGCTAGMIYSDTRRPLVTNMDQTPSGVRSGEEKSVKLMDPITGLGLSVEVDSNALGDAMKRAGLKRLYYADIRTRSILLGIWQENTIIAVGE